MTINKFEPGTGFPVSGLFRYMVLKPAFYLIKFLLPLEKYIFHYYINKKSSSVK